jgi:hypothetical protein
MVTWEHLKFGGAPLAQQPRVLLLGEILQNKHGNKKGVVYVCEKV